MNTFKKIMAWALVIISILGILACAAGIVGGWVINNRLTDSLMNLLDGIQTLTTSLEDSLSKAGSSLTTANSAISTLRDLGTQLGESASENTPILDRIAQVIQEQLSPTLDRIRETFSTVQERIKAINSAIEALNVLPGVNLPTLSPQLDEVNQLVQNVVDAIDELKSNIADFKAGVVQNVLTALSAKIEPIATLLANLEDLVNTSLERIDNLQAGVANLQAKLPMAIDLLTVGSTIILAWLILAQISLLLAARTYLKSGSLPWAAAPAEQVLEDTALDS